MRKEKVSNRISDTLGIPRDIISDMMKLVITGNGDIQIEGFCGIGEYTNEKIEIIVKGGSVAVSGNNLTIEEITDEYIDLRGRVKLVEFM